MPTFSKEATVSNTSTFLRLRKLPAEKQESSRRQSKINKFFSLVVTSNDRNANDLMKLN